MEQAAPARVLGGDTVTGIPAAAREPRALPGLAYTSAELFEWERRRIFQQGWVPVERVADVTEKGAQAAVMSAGRNILVAGTGDRCECVRQRLSSSRARTRPPVLQGPAGPGVVRLPRLGVRARWRAAERAPL